MNRSARRVAVTCIVIVVVASVLVFRWARVRQHTDTPVASQAGSSVPQAGTGNGAAEVPAQPPATVPVVIPPPPTPTGPTRAPRPTLSSEAATTTPEASSRPPEDVERMPAEPSPSAAPIAPADAPPIVESIPDVGVHAGTIRPPEESHAVPTTGIVTNGVLRKDTLALQAILRRYEEAYDRLDADAAAAIWSTVDSRSLARAFSLLRYQELDLDDCSIAVTESDATAQCPGRLRYARRIGDGTPKTEYHVWMIEFARRRETWQIVRVTAQ